MDNDDLAALRLLIDEINEVKLEIQETNKLLVKLHEQVERNANNIHHLRFDVIYVAAGFMTFMLVLEWASKL